MANKKTECKYLQREWIGQMTETLRRLHPELSKDQIEDFVIEQYQEKFKDHDVSLSDTYENTVTNTTLGQLTDWIEDYKPTMAESGVFFYPKDKKRNVNVEIIKEAMLDARKIHKKEKFEAMERGDAFTASVKDLQQGNDKKAANSGYGAEGQSSSFLYNVNSAMSVTASGRGQLSTMILNFENLFEDNVKFWNMDEFHTWINHVLSEKPDYKYNTYEIINRTPTRSKWVERFTNKVIHETLCDVSQIERVYDSLDEEARVRTFYKCNLRDFLLNKAPQKIFEEIAFTDAFIDDEGNPTTFVDPNKVPKEIKSQVKELTEQVVEFVSYKFSNFRYQDKARYSRRKVILVSDTDSSFVFMHNILMYVMHEVLPYRLFKKRKDYETYKLKIMNVLASFVSGSIANTLWNYTGYVNIAPEDRPNINAKNEFLYKRLVITYAKKSYIGWLARQEAVVFKEPKLDTKGVSFFKSTSTERTTDFIYNDLLKGQIFEPSDDVVSLKRIYKTMVDFQKQITDEISRGEIGFLKRSIKVKSKDAYADPMRINAYKSAYVWNKLNDDKDRIELPATVTIAKVKLTSKKDLAALAPWPKIYNRAVKLFETDPVIGDHEETVYRKGERVTKVVKGKGINSIAIPGDLDVVPEWILPILDVETLTRENLALTDQIMKPLGFHEGKSGVNGKNMAYYTNIVRI